MTRKVLCEENGSKHPMTRGHDLNTCLKNLSSNPTLDKMEEIFLLGEQATPDFSEFVEMLIETELWTSLDFSHNTLKDLCIDLSVQIQQQNDALEWEPNYHCRAHFKDVCIALSLLIQSQKRIDDLTRTNLAQAISAKEAWILLFCAIAHDLGHDGTVNKHPFELEKRSVKLVQNFLEKIPLAAHEWQEIISVIEPIILATDPKYLPTLINKLNTGNNLDRSDYLSIILVEADLLASVLPTKGKILGERLSDEWRLTNPEAALAVKTNRGRLAFLENIRFFSPHSQALGMENIRKISISRVRE